MKTILSHANLIDCVEPKLRPDTAVLIEDGRIRAILPGREVESAGDAQVIDLKGGYLMPGLWDVHIHPDYLSLDEMPLADQVTLFGHRLAAALTESGIVGLRCAGAHHFMDVAWKRAFDSGQHVGPRLFASGYFLTTTGGHFLTSGHALEVDGPYGWVKAIREQIKTASTTSSSTSRAASWGRRGTSTPIPSCSTTRSALLSRSAGSAASRSWRMPPTRKR
jgi:imidazolonepropionase-like amidohydrolase